MNKDNIQAIVENSAQVPEREETDHVDSFIEAVALAQGQMPNPKLDKTNPHYRNKYSSLTALRDAYRKALSDNKIAIVSRVKYRDGQPFLITTLHGYGDCFESEHLLPANVKIQELGSHMTYGRRYAVQVLLGLSGEEDDDGNIAQGIGGQAPIAADTGELLTNEQTAEIMDLIARTKTKIADFLKYFDAPSLSDLPAKQYATAKAKLEAKLQAKQYATAKAKLEAKLKTQEQP